MKTLSLTLAAAMIATAAAGAVAPAQANSDSAAAQAAAYRVTLKVSTDQAVQREDKVTLTGKVSPKAPGSKVTVQIRYEGQKNWKAIGTAKVQGDGSYKYVDKPKTRVDRAYRVLKPASGATTKGISKERDVEVYGWEWLDARTPSASKDVLEIFSMPINGEDYLHTLYSATTTPSAFVEYTLGRKCLLLDATFGLSDRTATGGAGRIQVHADGVSLYDHSFPLGESSPQSLDVDDVYRVRIDFAQLNGTQPEPSAGAAKVLCD